MRKVDAVGNPALGNFAGLLGLFHFSTDTILCVCVGGGGKGRGKTVLRLTCVDVQCSEKTQMFYFVEFKVPTENFT